MERVEMAIRLARWLADQTAASHAKSASLLAIAQQYARDGGYVDWRARCCAEANQTRILLGVCAAGGSHY